MSVDYLARGCRATITINDPDHHNPMSVETMAGLVDATREALEDADVRMVVYTGAGDKTFSAGGDLSGSFADDPVGLHRPRGRLAELFRLMTRGGKPTIARVNGNAIAGGFGLAVACDFTVCVDDARLGTSEVRVGLWPMMISAVLVRAMPPKAVLELMLTGRLIDPVEAQRLGAVSRIVARSDLDEAVDQIVEGIASMSPAALTIGRDSFYAMRDAAFETALDRLQGGLTEIALTEDAAEGVAAFLAKRDPEWEGR